MALPPPHLRAALSALALASTLATPRSGSSQNAAQTVVTGTVLDAGSRVGLASATVEWGAVRTATDFAGRFRLVLGDVRADSLRVRRLGYAPRSLAVSGVAPNASLQVLLEPLAEQLVPTRVVAERPRYTGRLAGYYQRLERRTAGTFITRAQLDREGAGILTNVLQKVPGVTVMRGRGAPRVSMRGRDCRPLVWLDGNALTAGEVDLDGFAPQTLQGIELYLGATAPTRYQPTSGRSRCGTILLWSRGVDTDPIRPFTGASPEELQRRLDAAEVYRATEVSQEARALGAGVVPVHPQELRATGVAGEAVVEFVVDEQGRVGEDDFGVVFATHPDFAQAVRHAVLAARFSPAERDGRPVRQLVRQRFYFPL